MENIQVYSNYCKLNMLGVYQEHMSTIVIDLAYGKAHLRGDSMYVVGTPWRNGSATEADADTPPGENITRTLPLSLIDHVVICPQVCLSGALLQALLCRGIGVSILGQQDLLGSVVPAGSAKGGLRIEQYRRSCEADWVVRQARVLVSTKIHNQAFMLRRRRTAPPESFFREMKKLLKSTLCATNASELMGIEGRASALYFAEWAKTLPPAFPFVGRSRRPPKDAVNACLSYLSALCRADMLRAVAHVGLDADLGVLHSTEDYRHNLVLDLMEPFRPILVEGVTRDVLNHGMLSEESTEMCDADGGCYLTSQGRVALIRRFEQRMLSSFLQNGKNTTLRACMLQVALQWKRAVTDPGHLASNFKLS